MNFEHETKPAPVRSTPPSGTVTFAFTDIEGSTRRWERDREAMQTAVRRHDALVREAIEASGGYVFKTVGDAFCAAFNRPEDAAAAMLAAQRALLATDFSATGGLAIRAAIHTGTADERDGDYYGPAVNRVARLLAIGHGGQILASGVSADLLQGSLEARASLRDLGQHRLKDLARPEQVYQLQAPDLAADFPPLRSLDAFPNNLPRVLTSFVGRERELVALGALLEAHQLVTIVGSGGIGKTRTALQVAANALGGSSDGAWFIELAPLTSGDYIVSTAAQALGLRIDADGEPLASFVRALRAKNVLMIFDNCEHLVEPAARVISAILQGCPHVKIIASSRQALGISGEQTFRLPSLALPDAERPEGIAAGEALSSAAVALFVDRARAVDKRFSLNDDNAAAVVEICARLDGIPLAIELAAARANILSPKQLRDRLDERFRVLAGGSRDALPRQQTLRALIDWSHELLDARERAFFRSLGIFVNGFVLAGAVAVGSREGTDELDAFDLLASLVEKSIVLAELDGDALRYRLLESTRLYALEKLEAAGEREQCASRHLRFMRDLFVGAKEESERTGRLAEPDALFVRELEDVRAALEGPWDETDRRTAGELLSAIGAAWLNIGLGAEGRARIDAWLGSVPAPEPLLASQLLMASAAIGQDSIDTNVRVAARALELARISGDAPTIAEALHQYARDAGRSRRVAEADAALSEAEGMPAQSAGQRLRLIECRAFLSMMLKNDWEPAARLYREARTAHRSLGNVTRAAVATLNLAEIEHARGETGSACELAEEALATLRKVPGSRQALANGLMNQAGYLAALGETSAGRAVAREAIREIAPRAPQGTMLANALEHLALTLSLDGDYERGAALAGFAEHSHRRRGYVREFTEILSHDRLTAILAERLGAEELERRLERGAKLAPEEAVALALADP